MIIKSGKLYDRAKFVALILLPALSTFYFALSGAWNLPNATAVIGTLAALGTFLGTILGISNTQYKNDPYNYDGDLMLDEGTPGDSPELTGVYNVSPTKFYDGQEIKMRVKRINTTPQKPSKGI